MNKKTIEILKLAGILTGVYLIWRYIEWSKNLIGDNPLNAVGGDSTDTGGWLSQWYMQTSGNADSQVYDPFGWVGSPNLGNNTIESIFDPFGWYF